MKPILVSSKITNEDLYWSGQHEVFLKVIKPDESLKKMENYIKQDEIREHEKKYVVALSKINDHIIRKKMFGETKCKKCNMPKTVTFDEILEELRPGCRICEE